MRFWNPPALDPLESHASGTSSTSSGAGVPVVPTVVLDDPAAVHLPARARRARLGGGPSSSPCLGASGHDAALVDAESVRDRRRRHRRGTTAAPRAGAARSSRRSGRAASGRSSSSTARSPTPCSSARRPGTSASRRTTAAAPTRATAPPERRCEAGRARPRAPCPSPPLYARVDGVETAGGFLVMEVEVHEPGLFFSAAPEAARRSRRPSSAASPPCPPRGGRVHMSS